MIKLSLCHKGCCPTVSVAKGQIVISDDFGGQVKLTKEELKILVDKYPEITKIIG
ncbi:hypothetical protein [Heliorestis acidaminivorans]|uniref:hypothetical protein n=1 Tax=Heliorestis acidaminivorans TaxID=553427 RepID=UPI00147958B7|nr:hypothetical protein [Heliorestis acidaminivorans]